MSKLKLSGKICDIDEEIKENHAGEDTCFIFLENGRYPDQVSVLVSKGYQIGQSIDILVKNLSGISKKGKPWQFYAEI